VITVFYSSETGGFYVNSKEPPGAVEIDFDLYMSLLKGQEEGSIISYDDRGYPQLVANPL